MPPGIGSLESLQKLSLVKASKKIIRELGNSVQLRKLGITKLESGHGRDLCASIQNMEDLSSLHVSSTNEEEFLALDDVSRSPRLPCSLYLGVRLQYIPQWISSVHSLAKICLKGSKLLNCPLEAIQALPSSLELRLVDVYIGEELKFKSNRFQKLVILEIRTIQ
ncbi:hypothetical protein Pint_03763 [Pistacia integerrima]|uniref:Uncharacterized protein n=1 Tax=Pistacia integerrima TaxID=434235 RepID=A0ACC0Z426_9ROSI|nr:hypothetical protein Pint_03763 [Pistacia integerrima]